MSLGGRSAVSLDHSRRSGCGRRHPCGGLSILILGSGYDNCPADGPGGRGSTGPGMCSSCLSCLVRTLPVPPCLAGLGPVRLYPDASRTTTGRVKASVSGSAPPSRSSQPGPVVAVGVWEPDGGRVPYAKLPIDLAELAYRMAPSFTGQPNNCSAREPGRSAELRDRAENLRWALRGEHAWMPGDTPSRPACPRSATASGPDFWLVAGLVIAGEHC